MEMTIREAVDRYAELQAQIDGAKIELDSVKGFIEKKAENDLEDTKNKNIIYYGSSGNRVIVQNTATVKPISWVVIKEVLGKTSDDFIKEEKKLSLNEIAKTMLANMFKGDYIEDSMENLVGQMSTDPKTQKILMKRMKGKFKQDMNNIRKYAELGEKEASDYAFMVSEVMAYQNILRIIEASGFKGSIAEAVEKVRSALIIEDGIKVTFEAEE